MNVPGESVACLIFLALEAEQTKKLISHSGPVRAGCDAKDQSPQLQDGSGMSKLSKTQWVPDGPDSRRQWDLDCHLAA